MKTTLKIALATFILTGFSACSIKDNEDKLKTKSDDGEIFYYYGSEKVFLTQSLDKTLLRFTSDIDKEQMLALISEFTSLEIIDGAYWGEGPLRFAAFESMDGKPISSEIMKSLKNKDKVISATYMYQYHNGKLQGIMDEFIVQLKGGTSYEQLEILAKENGCTIGEEYPFVKNRFTLHVSKTSELNAMQVANKFYETKLFAFSEPNFVTLNAAGIIKK